MLQLYSSSATGVSTPVDSNIVFNNKTLQTGCTAVANTPTNTITLNKSGLYMVEFNGIISGIAAAEAEAEASVIPTVANFVGVQMFNNGNAVPEAVTGATSAADTDVNAVSFQTLVRVRPGCCSVDNTARLTFKVVGNNANVYFANVVVTKLA